MAWDVWDCGPTGPCNDNAKPERIVYETAFFFCANSVLALPGVWTDISGTVLVSHLFFDFFGRGVRGIFFRLRAADMIVDVSSTACDCLFVGGPWSPLWFVGVEGVSGGVATLVAGGCP